MTRVGAFALLILFVSLVVGCSEKTASVQETGIRLGFSNCLTFAAWVWIDGYYVGTYTSEQPSLIDVTAGGHTLFVRGNIVVGDSSFCWTQDFSVSEEQVTEVTLDCVGAKCETVETFGVVPPLNQ